LNVYNTVILFSTNHKQRKYFVDKRLKKNIQEEQSYTTTISIK